MAEENRKMSKGRKILVGFIVVLFLLTIGAYFFGVYYFTKHFLPGTQVNGFNCSYMTQEETEKLLQKRPEYTFLLFRQRKWSGEHFSRSDRSEIYFRWQCEQDAA